MSNLLSFELYKNVVRDFIEKMFNVRPVNWELVASGMLWFQKLMDSRATNSVMFSSSQLQIFILNYVNNP